MKSILTPIAGKLQCLSSRFINHLYESYMRRRLRNSQFSILCSNCIGGIIYHRLGVEFQSPTINLWMNQHDFIRFVSNLEEYISKDLEFIADAAAYPVAMLGDVKIHFNHYKTETAARDSWNRRKERIHWDSIYVILYDRDGLSHNDLVALKNISCKKLIVLSENTYPDIPYVKTITAKDRLNGPQFLDLDYFGIRTFEKHFDFVKWLNSP